MRRRVETAAAELQLRCATARVLSAVLTLLLGWNRVRDDRVRVHHIAARFPAGTRLVTATTIGRLLAKLDELALIVYRPAIGRGAFAEIAIHPRFLEGIAEMVYTGRGGRNMVSPAGNSEAETIAFSGRGFLIGDLSPTTPPPPAANAPADTQPDTRPGEVVVPVGAVAEVIGELPGLYRDVPPRVRWLLGAEVKRYLARGWRPDQILAVLAAPLPANIVRPLKLAQWRLSHNMIGAGPLLAPLQHRWEAAQAKADEARRSAAERAAYLEVVAAVGAELEQRMLASVARAPAATICAADRHRAVVHAARMARRGRPGVGLQVAVRSWLGVQPATAQTEAVGGQPGTVSVLHELGTGGRCVRCNSVDAHVRPELPLPTPVCDSCWSSCQHDDPDEVAENNCPRTHQSYTAFDYEEAC